MPPEPVSLPADLNGWLAYLEQLHPKSIALGLERVNEVKSRLALQPGFPTITVAGTNGKGSTCAMLERIYTEAGYSVACYSSPHLLRYNERVRVNCQEVNDAALCTAFAAVEAARQQTPLTYFEYGTLAALWHFVHTEVDVAILEVGLGGRLDAVNAFDPACSVITSIDLDHMDYLGNNRASIGREKAGVFRRSVAALCGDPQPPETVTNYAKVIGADFRQIGRDFRFTRKAVGWDFHMGAVEMSDLPVPALAGDFQLFNASCALGVVTCLQPVLPVKPQHIARGLREVVLAGRFQRITGHPQIILDVAHNPHAAHALAENLRKTETGGRTFAVFAMLADKDIAGVVRALGAMIDRWFVADIHYVRGASAQQLAEKIRLAIKDAKVECHREVSVAFNAACHAAGENDRIIVFGSFYTVADVMRALPATHLGD